MSQARVVRVRHGAKRVCACGARLSTSNRGTRCGPCERRFVASLSAPPALAVDFWYADHFEEAFKSHSIGAVLRAFRTDERHKETYGPAGIHQAWLASWLGLTQPQLSRIEQGRTAIDSLKVLIRWARTLSIPAELLWFDLPGTTLLGGLPKKPDRRRRSRGAVKRGELIYARKSVGLTQSKLAATIGVAPGTVQRWEANESIPQPRLWPMIADALDIPRDRLAELLTPADPSGEHATEPIGESYVRHPMDGRLMAKVDEGVYLSGPGNEPVWLPAFYIDVYPVTNAEYAQFITATGHAPPHHWPHGQYPGHTRDHPVVFVNWDDAAAYSEWAGKSLPSGQQWEKAARGTRGAVYPWGDQTTPAKCNVRENGVGDTTPVDTYQSGASPYGVFDLCGNTWEWCATISKPGRHELKGGAWTSPFLRATPSSFNDAAASMCDDDTGFRCATTETLPA